jgi:hypothetical protein
VSYGADGFAFLVFFACLYVVYASHGAHLQYLCGLPCSFQFRSALYLLSCS